MIHHSLTEDGGTVSWPAIEKYHKETNHWLDIGYHAGIEVVTDNPDLTTYKYQAIVGRPVYAIAAACPQGLMNEKALHVCCVGNFDLVSPTKEMLSVLLKRVLIPWATEFSIPPTNWVGHREYNPHKSCPGNMFDLNALRVYGALGRIT